MIYMLNITEPQNLQVTTFRETPAIGGLTTVKVTHLPTGLQAEATAGSEPRARRMAIELLTRRVERAKVK
jgi:hypothetical protein